MQNGASGRCLIFRTGRNWNGRTKPGSLAYQAAKKAVDDFDKRHTSTSGAIIQLARMLESGGWGAVEFDSDNEHVPADRRIPGNFERPVSLGALRSIGTLPGTSLAAIVAERRALIRERDRAYAAIPAEIRNLCSEKTAQSKPRGPQRRG
jgi:hypothetical protein